MSEIRSISNLRFAAFNYRFVLENGEKHEITLIAIMHNNTIIRMTNFHKYVGIARSVKHIYQNHEPEVRRVCNFLNYVIFEQRYTYKINKITDITFEAVEDYLLAYSNQRNRFGNYVSEQSANRERCAVCMFMANIRKKYPNGDGHYYARKIVENTNNQVIKHKQKYIWEYEIEAVYKEQGAYDLIRDIPDKAIPVILKNVKLYEPELYFAVILQLTAGLREGEVVNVRRADSKYYGGIRYTKNLGKFQSFEIDLKKEYLLRSDGKSTGKIKKERSQSVYPPFLEAVQEAYTEHLKLIPKDMVEEEGPMFVNNFVSAKTGKKMAISVRSYTNRIKKVFYEHILPDLICSNEIENRTFAKLVGENSFGLHAFRHWFSVQLVLNNEDLTGIAFWRGDSSLESAQSYLVNKGELMKRYREANEEIANTIAEKITIEVVNDL